MVEFINFLHKNFGITNDAAATVVITLLTFFSGILATELLGYIKAYHKRKNYRELLRINLINLIKGVHRQAVSYDKFYKQLNINHYGAFELQQKSISAIGVFRQLGYENLYNSCFNGVENYFTKNKKKRAISFTNIWATLEYLDKFHDESFKNVDKFLALNADINSQRNQWLGKANQIIETIRLTLHTETVPVPLGLYFNSIEEILVNLHNQPLYTTPKVMNDFFVQKLLELNRDSVDVIKTYGSLLRPVELNAALLETSLRFTNQSNLMDAYEHNFKALALGFFDSFDKMKGAYRSIYN